MSNQSMEVKVKELLELKRMKEELEAEIAAVEDEIKSVNLKALLLLLLVSWEGGLSCLGKHTKEGKQKQTQKKN